MDQQGGAGLSDGVGHGAEKKESCSRYVGFHSQQCIEKYLKAVLVLKKIVKIYDYVDLDVPMLVRMYHKRLKGYKAIGYSVQSNTAELENAPNLS